VLAKCFAQIFLSVHVGPIADEWVIQKLNDCSTNDLGRNASTGNPFEVRACFEDTLGGN
jgi:hypothetical protein